MNREEKNAFVDDIRQRFASAPLVVLTEYGGSTVSETNQFRRACEPAGMRFQVVKNTLCRRAIEGTDKAALAPYFKGTIGVVLSGEDPIAAAKLLKEQVKNNQKLQVKAGFFEGTVLDAKGVEAVADLPSREELLGKLLATILEGPRQLLRVVSAPGRDFTYLLANRQSALEHE